MTIPYLLFLIILCDTTSIVADWITIIALPFTILGLCMTYYQGRKIKSAADAAETSANAMANKIDSMLTIESLTKIMDQLNNCDSLLQNENWVEVISYLRSAKVQLIVLQKNRTYKDVTDSDFRLICRDIQLDIDNLRSKINGEEFEPDKVLINNHIDKAIEILTIIHAEIKKKHTDGNSK